jgi:cell filamentation protein, protein adenylyltransferase
MSRDKYGTGQDPYCLDNSDVLINSLGISDAGELADAEQQLTELAALDIEFCPPPYDLNYLCQIHRALFGDIFDWAGKVRSIDLSKGDTRFCHCHRIEIEANKQFTALAAANYFQGDTRDELITHVAELYTEINMIHPFREGNGRAQRVLFEHLIINCGYEFSLEGVSEDEWIRANIAGVNCDYGPMTNIFARCIGDSLQ